MAGRDSRPELGLAEVEPLARIGAVGFGDRLLLEYFARLPAERPIEPAGRPQRIAFVHESLGPALARTNATPAE